MPSFKATGLLHEIFDVQQVTEKFAKRDFVLEIPGQYPEHIKFQLVQDKCDLIEGLTVGEEVEVDFNLRGKGFNKNGQMLYFNNLDAWKIKRTQAAPAAAKIPAGAHQQQPVTSDDDNDLPF